MSESQDHYFSFLNTKNPDRAKIKLGTTMYVVKV